MKVLQEHSPGCIKEQTIKNYSGLKIAIDASMCLYQFLIAVRQDGQSLTNENGDITSHLQGMFYRTIRLLDNGIKPVYVFDGKPPELKSGELAKRSERRADAEDGLKAAQEEGNAEDIEKFERRLVKVTKEHNNEVKHLLTLMGIPYVEAPGEAEATCAALCKAGLVYATGTEDMDALTFGTPRLLRHLTMPEQRKLPIIEIDLSIALRDLNMTQDEFIDFCILLGCDYTATIRNVGPSKAYELITEHKNIESSLKNLPERYVVPTDFLHKEAHAIFIEPDVIDVETVKLTWGKPDKDALVKYLSEEKGFNAERVGNGVQRMLTSRKFMSQTRLDSMFAPKATGASGSVNPAKIAAEKKKAEEAKQKANKRKNPTGGPSGSANSAKKARR